MPARSLLLCAIAAMASSMAACSSESPSTSDPVQDAAAPDAEPVAKDSGDSAHDASMGSSSSDDDDDDDDTSASEDASHPDHDAAPTDSGHAHDAAECVRPPYKTTDECTNIGKPNGPALPSCSKFDNNGQLVCPSIPGCTIAPDPTGSYCVGDDVHCGLSECGHICQLPDWEPCYDVATGKCLEGC